MSTTQTMEAPLPRTRPTIWGLTPTQLHDRFWAARGVQVVRQGEPSEIVEGAELFLLTDPQSLVIFKLGRYVDLLSWLQPELLSIRLGDARERAYREQVITDVHGRFARFRRIYAGVDSRRARVALTPDPVLARLWQRASDPSGGRRRLRREVSRNNRAATRGAGQVYDRGSDQEVMQFIRDLVRIWKYPDSTIHHARKQTVGVWAHEQQAVDPSARVSGPVWIGSGRRLTPDLSVIGPAVLWDDPASRPAVDAVHWDQIEPTTFPTRPVRLAMTSFHVLAKRGFDIVFSLIALLLTLPFYPLIMLAILVEDGRPFFFRHRRETLNGREFLCLKFRSMRKDAEELKAQLVERNQADGPQFFIEDDPRLTVVGDFLRRFNIDELPQFINVLLGHMSVVGPRPSPYEENQFCPAWREARLSVRPGITGLWQVRRTRRHGADFQEWIKFDLEYVERASWWLDMKIILKTASLLLRGVRRP